MKILKFVKTVTSYTCTNCHCEVQYDPKEYPSGKKEYGYNVMPTIFYDCPNCGKNYLYDNSKKYITIRE